MTAFQPGSPVYEALIAALGRAAGDRMNVLDLFSGIGGFSLGLERAGMRTVAFCEIDPYCRKILAKLASAPVYDDVRTLTAARLMADATWNVRSQCKASGSEQQRTGAARQSIDLICGGFPCRTSAWPERARASPALSPAYGRSTPELLARYDPATSSWRTSQLCLDGELSEFSETWPRSGLMRNGTAYLLPPLVRVTDEIDFGSWPTPRTSQHNCKPTQRLALAVVK